MKTKRILNFLLIFALVGIGIAQWAKVTFQPLYSDTRFQPSDKLHAGCTNSADILFSPQGQKITNFKIILSYNPEKLEILRILPIGNDTSISSKIEYNKIILEVHAPTFSSSTETKWFFSLYFKSNTTGKNTLTIMSGSEASTSTDKTYPLTWSFDLEFAEVPECEPDIIPPSINLIYPKDSNEDIHLDQYFIFDIKDIGKGINKSSVIISFDWEQYFNGSDNVKWNGNYLTFYPSKWIPVSTDIDLKIMISDQQNYGWSNKTESVYNFVSASWMKLHKNISPIMFRKIAQEAEKISASVDECQLLGDLYMKADLLYQKELHSIIQKLWCNIASLDTSLVERRKNTTDSLLVQDKKYRNISVFWTLWWILFFVTFGLWGHYLLSYKKHKKLSTERRIPKE